MLFMLAYFRSYTYDEVHLILIVNVNSELRTEALMAPSEDDWEYRTM